MKRTSISIVVAILLTFLICHPGFGLTSEALVRLKKAGISDHTIQVIVQEKAIETATTFLSAIPGIMGGEYRLL